MHAVSVLRRIRPSNLVLLAALPFIVYLFASEPNYQRSLVAILGIEDGAGEQLVGFCLVLSLFLTGLLLPISYWRGTKSGRRLRRAAHWAVFVHAALLAVLLAVPDAAGPYIESIVANTVDPYTSDWVVAGETPRILTEAYADVVRGAWAWIVVVYGAVYCVTAGITLAAHEGMRHNLPPVVVRYAALALTLMSLIGLFYVLFVGHAGFATGLMITLRAAVFAYLAAAVLGLGLAGLQGLAPGRRTFLVYPAICALLGAGAVYFFMQPTETYVLVGELDERVAIIQGTPSGLSDVIKEGVFEDQDYGRLSIRAAEDVAAALDLVANQDNVSAAFVPIDAAPATLPVVWEVTFLPSEYRSPAFIMAAIGGLLLVLCLGGLLHSRHPLAVGAEFFIDTVRGIPMLVIILYVGLPLSGAIKDATDGGIDLPNFVRGVIAISIGYSAYMAEIFRAGIEAVPRGQIEAARSLGMSRWLVFRLVILPQALQVVTPPLGNEFIAMLKDTSLLSILSVRDVTQRMREFQASSFLPFEPFNSAAILYVALTLACASGLKWIERRNDRRGAR